MKKVFVANKRSYGSEFYEVCDTLENLKRAIVAHELEFEDDSYTDEMYTEELFKKHCEDGEYTLYEVELHEEEEITFGSYDGQSWFRIEKIHPNILSNYRQIREE
jgi:hypothetical protein